jgi:hypothetical protein
MAHFAKVENGIVTQVIVIDQETLNEGHWGDPSLWVQTSYNTFGGEHPEGRPLRKNYAGIGFSYDGIGFYSPQPYPSWTKNADTYIWEAPTPIPTTGMHRWDEETLSWVEIPLSETP